MIIMPTTDTLSRKKSQKERPNWDSARKGQRLEGLAKKQEDPVTSRHMLEKAMEVYQAAGDVKNAERIKNQLAVKPGTKKPTSRVSGSYENIFFGTSDSAGSQKDENSIEGRIRIANDQKDYLHAAGLNIGIGRFDEAEAAYIKDYNEFKTHTTLGLIYSIWENAANDIFSKDPEKAKGYIRRAIKIAKQYQDASQYMRLAHKLEEWDVLTGTTPRSF
jgi:tetratricopeptide (TPR) repeat protein